MSLTEHLVYCNHVGCNPEFYLVDEHAVSPKHWQKEVEIVYAKSGWVEVNVDGNIMCVEKNNMLFIGSGVVHYFDTKKPGSALYVIKMMPRSLIGPLFSESNKEAIKRLYNQSFMLHMNEKMLDIVTEITRSDISNNFSECFLTAKLMELTASILSQNDRIYSRILSTPYDDAQNLSRMLNYIEQHSGDKLTLKMLSSHLGFSESYCSKYIKKNINMNFLECLDAVRIAHAEELLMESNGSITEIAYKVGFSSTQNFNRVFKSIKNISPSEYKKSKQDKIKCK